MGKRVDAAAAGGVPVPAPAGRGKKVEAGAFEASLKKLRPPAKRAEPEPSRPRVSLKPKAEAKKSETAKTERSGKGRAKETLPAAAEDAVVWEGEGLEIDEQKTEADPLTQTTVASGGEAKESEKSADWAIGEELHDAEGVVEPGVESGAEKDALKWMLAPMEPSPQANAVVDEDVIEEVEATDDARSALEDAVVINARAIDSLSEATIEPEEPEALIESGGGERRSQARPVALDMRPVEGFQDAPEGAVDAMRPDEAPKQKGFELLKDVTEEVGEKPPESLVALREATDVNAKISLGTVEAATENVSSSTGAPRVTDMKSAPQTVPGAFPPVDQRFAAENHENIVTAIRSELLPNGGTVRIRLDPPELGALAVRIDVRDGVVAASFETSNEEAAKLLSHSLGQLKQSLESQGVTVERLHVQQAPKDGSNTSGQDSSEHQEGREHSLQQQEQQRREMLRRMWRRVAGARDEVDVMA